MATTESANILQLAKSLTDEEVVGRVLAGETALFEIVMRRYYNQRLYRVARAILGDDAEAEDVMQDAYVRAFQQSQPVRRAGQVFHLVNVYRDSRSTGARKPSASS